MEKSASQARIFDNNECTILSKCTLKSGSFGWNGIPAHTSDVRTCDLELPRGHATVKCGKFFEVRYFLNVIVSVSHSKVITIQLPIVLIHMNSLDVVPNSVAQVAAAIEEKRAKAHQRSHSRHQQPRSAGAAPTSSAPPNPGSPKLSRRPSSSASVQGRAFAAPRKQSLDRMRTEAEELFELGKLLDTSPRKYHYSPRRRAIASTHKAQPNQNENYEYQTPPSNRKARILSDELGDEVTNIRARLRHMRSNETNRSIISTRNDPATNPSLRRGNSLGSRSQKVGFRDLEKAEAGSPIGPGTSNLNMSRFEPLSAAAGRSSHAGQLKKMKSVERWRGPSWFSDRRERSREREERERMMANWI
jgi:hypothetical protein